MIYCVELTYWPKKGPTRSQRFRYTGNKRVAHKLAKETIVRMDNRYKQFMVRIKVDKTKQILKEWIKFAGVITRTI